MELEQQTEGGVRGIPSGSQILHEYPYNLPSHALQHIVFTGHLDIKEQACSEPKKRKGGWPKGKKRKPPKEFSAPRAPTTGYVIFLNEQRIKTKATHPDLPFTEITKMLAAQWSQLSQAEKQKYIKEAEKDKQRYMKELKAYQDSEAYQAFLERRAVHKVKTLCGTISIGSRSENEALALSTIDRDESNDLYCRTCNQFFSSFHNKKEHLMGKQHLQNLTGEFEKETAEFSKHQKLQEEKEEKEESEEEIDSTDVFQFGGLTFQKNFASSDFCFLQEFIFRLLKFKEFELCELKRSLTKAYEEQESLKKQLEDLKNQQLKLEMDFASIKAYSGTLEKEFENLNMVPMLFQFHLQIVDTRLQSTGTRPGAEPWADCQYPRLAGGLSRFGGPDPDWLGAGWLERQTSSGRGQQLVSQAGRGPGPRLAGGRQPEPQTSIELRLPTLELD